MLRLRAHLVNNGNLVGNWMEVELPEINDPEKLEMRLELIQDNVMDLLRKNNELHQQIRKLKRRPWWVRVLGI